MHGNGDEEYEQLYFPKEIVPPTHKQLAAALEQLNLTTDVKVLQRRKVWFEKRGYTLGYSYGRRFLLPEGETQKTLDEKLLRMRELRAELRELNECMISYNLKVSYSRDLDDYTVDGMMSF